MNVDLFDVPPESASEISVPRFVYCLKSSCIFQGSWYGVEWDNERGKHNGTLNGVNYFECRLVSFLAFSNICFNLV